LNGVCVRGWLIAALALIVGCGDGTPATPVAPSPSPTPPPGPPPLTATVVIGSNNAFAPAEVTVAVGGRVTFVNQNNRPHDITSDPLHLHTDCPPIIEVGFIQPGQTKQTGALNVARVCGFHDHMQETNSDLHGRIIVQ
jgi:hypothetical protein